MAQFTSSEFQMMANLLSLQEKRCKLYATLVSCEKNLSSKLFFLIVSQLTDKTIDELECQADKTFKRNGEAFDVANLPCKLKNTPQPHGKTPCGKGQTIEIVLQNKVIPLLMEYFSGKTDIVSKIFSDTNWNVTYDTTNFLWDISPR